MNYDDVYAVIMAGGKGTRLWPEGRRSRPKQLLKLLGEESLIQATLRRISPLVSPERAFVITTQEYSDEIADQLEDIPKENIISEPAGRNTAPCIGLAAVHLQKRAGDPVMVVLPADHAIADEARLIDTVRAGVEAVRRYPDSIETIGIVPKRPETGLGYIKFGDERFSCGEIVVYDVEKFVEKPSLARAKEFLSDGHYLWNTGTFIWKVSRVLSLFEKYLPEHYLGLRRIRDALGSASEMEIAEEVYSDFIPISIDYGIMEKADNVLVVKGDFGWNDVGSWSALAEVHESDCNGNIVSCEHVCIDTKDSIIRSPKLVVTVGIKNMVIVETKDVLLVCRKDRSQDIRKVVEQLEREGKLKYL